MNFSKIVSLTALTLGFSQAALADTFPLCEARQNVPAEAVLINKETLKLTRTRDSSFAKESFAIVAADKSIEIKCEFQFPTLKATVEVGPNRRQVKGVASNCMPVPEDTIIVFYAAFASSDPERNLNLLCTANPYDAKDIKKITFDDLQQALYEKSGMSISPDDDSIERIDYAPDSQEISKPSKVSI